MLGAAHAHRLAKLALPAVLDDLASDLLLARVPLGEGVVHMLGQQGEVLPVHHIFHAELVHVDHETLVVDEIFVLLLD